MEERAIRLLAEMAELWNKTEARAKEIEQFRGEAITACINEMRYAGRRVVDVLAHLNGKASDDNFDVVEHLALAKAYLINADHDLTDAAIFFAHLRLLRILETHGLEKVTEHCSEFAEVYPLIQEAHAIVTGSREDRSARRADYERLARDYVPRIIKLYRRITQIEGLKVVDDEALAQVGLWVRWTARIAFFGSIASILGLLMAIWALCLAYNPPA